MLDLARCYLPDSQTFLARFGVPGQPVIINGLTDNWPAQQKWTFDWFKASYGHLTVSVKREAQRVSETRELKFTDYLDYLRTTEEPSPFYLASWDFADDAPELHQDFTLPYYWQDDWLKWVEPSLVPRLLWLFIGPAGGGFRMHIDVGHTAAWNVQLVGRKRWALFPPEQVPLLYRGRVNAFAPDLERFPDFARSQGTYGIQEAGEAVFVPSGWWHQTQILEPSIAVSGNYANATNIEWVLDWLEKQGDLKLHAALRDISEQQA